MTEAYNTARLGVSDNQITTIGVSLQDSEGVLHILAERNNLQILKPVVGFVPILVIDGHLFGDSDEGFGNEPMDVSGRFLAADAKDNLFVSIGGVDIAMKESGLLTLDSDSAADTPEAAHFVQGEILNGSPFFHTCHFTVHDILGQGESS